MKMPLNLTAELKNLEQQTAEIDHLETQAENNLSTIQVLQNRVFFIEAELKNFPLSQEFFTCLSGMNQLTHSFVENEESV